MDTADINQIDGEIIRLKNELFKTKAALTNQICKRHRLVSELSLKVDRKNSQLREFQRSNFNDLGKVLRSLYVFESRLRREQQHIRRQLGERDAVIRQQQLEIAKLRQSLANYCSQNSNSAVNKTNETPPRGDVQVPATKPDLITSISSPQSPRRAEPSKNTDVDYSSSSSSSSTSSSSSSSSPSSSSPFGSEKPHGNKIVVGLPSTSEGPRKNGGNVLPEAGARIRKTNSSNNINFNKNVYCSKTVTDLSLNDISSFPNPTPNNNLFVVSNSIFSKNEFTYNEVSKEVITSVKQNGKVITSALKKADVCKYPSPKTVHFGKTTHIPEPDEDGQTDIVKTVETLLLQCGDSCTESENDTSSTASTETSPSVSQMVRKFESICTATAATAATATAAAPASPERRGSSGETAVHNGSYVAEVDLMKAAAELDCARPDSESPDSGVGGGGLLVLPGDLDHPRNNFEEFRFEDSDLDKEYRADGDGLECPGRPVSSVLQSEDCDGGGGGGGLVNYESFLEVTGLSQKSIITVQSCNRNLYGSHRNVQKPKDVKSRSRAKSASFEYSKPFSSTIKYWTEPYL